MVQKAVAKVVTPLPKFKGKGFLIRGSRDVEERYIGNSNVFKYEERDAFLKKKYKSRNPLDIAKEFYDKVPDLDDVSKMQYLDFNMWLRQEILLKADKMSMANSLELRVPVYGYRSIQDCPDDSGKMQGQRFQHEACVPCPCGP